MKVSRLAGLIVTMLLLAGCGQAGAPVQSAPASSSAPAASAAAASTAAAPVASSKPSAAAKPAVSGAPLPAPQTKGGDPNGYPIKLAYASPAVASWPYYAALSAGFFAQQHLAISMIQMAPNVTITALSKGEIDFTNAPSNALEGATRGLPFKVVLSLWSRSPWTISGKAELKSMKDLKGKTVGTNVAGSTPYLYLQAALKRAGMSMSDIQVVSSPGTQDTYALLLAGKVDAAVLSPPFDAQVEDKGFHEVQFIGDALQEPYIGLGTSTAFLGQQRPRVVGMIKALMDGNKWLKANPDGAAELITKNLNTPPDVAKRVTAKMLPLLSDTGDMAQSAVQESIDIQSQLTHTTISTKPDDMVDWGPLHEALGNS